MDAASGTLAIAVVLAALALAWEIKRRRARS
nr:VPEID-CTERM sorting domain-containing protein [uncultured Roseovarius sp.]